MSDYLQNCWYVAAWSHEVTDALLARTLLDRPVLLTRRRDGTAVALHDECPHRFAPLSRGKRDGDTLLCGYHGLRFAMDGSCVDKRCETRAHTARVKAYPLLERHTALWIWMGDEAAADPSLIPDFSFFDAPERSAFHGLTHVRANYQLEVDNLMDLSHLDYVHTATIGVGASLHGEHRVIQEGTTVHSNWWCPSIDNLPNLEPLFPMNGAPVDHWMDMRWDAPSLLRLNTGVTPAGESRENGFFTLQGHFATPETQFTTHYFWGISVKGEPHPHHQVVQQRVRQAFEEEDRPIIEAVQQRMKGDEFWSKRPLLFAEDSGAVRARRVLAKAIAAEQQLKSQKAG